MPQAQSYVDFVMESDKSKSEPDKFFVLGDNSAKSKDGRLWGPEYWVSRELLIGKALFIYWPHSWNKIPVRQCPVALLPQRRPHGTGPLECQCETQAIS